MAKFSNFRQAAVRKAGNVFVNIVATAIARVGPVHIQKILGKLVHQLNTSAPGLVTLHVRPKRSDDIVIDTIWSADDEDVGIVIQGPYLAEHDFTLETIRLYRRMFPKTYIVLSTWHSAAVTADMAELSSLCQIVFAERPATTGSHNFNLQKATTWAGVDAVRSAGRQYCLKSRTDQRMYRPNSLSYMKDLLNAYPVASDLHASGRVVELSIACCRYRPWSACDMFQFGHTSDLVTMWDVPDDPRIRSAAEYSSQPYRVIDIVNERVAEIRLHRAYAKAIGMNDAADYGAYYAFVRDALVLIDKEALDVYWHKYTAEEYGWAGVPHYGADQLLSRLSHADWQLLVSTAAVVPDFSRFEARLHAFEVAP